MNTTKNILNFCIDSIFFDYTNVGVNCEFNQVRKCKINSLYKTIPHSRILVSLSIIDDIILKNNESDIENNIESIHDLRENILYMLSFEKFIEDEQQANRPLSNDNDE